MTLPALFYGFLISSIYGTAFHAWRGNGGLRLLFYILLSWAGFWIGHFLAEYLGWTFASIGPLHAGLGTVLSVLFLVAGNWLSKVKTEDR